MNLQARLKTTTFVAVAILAMATAAQAHHSISMFDISNPIWVKGTVLSYEPIAPHAMIRLDATTADGTTRLWSIEGPFPGRVARILSSRGIEDGTAFFKPGDVIEVCGFDLREDLRASRGERNGTAEAPNFMHGHVVIMPDGRMQSWGPYGKTDNCVRARDDAETWRRFLDSDPLARDLWCNSSVYVKATSITSAEFIAEVSREIARPCE
jgi:hypothetical protein